MAFSCANMLDRAASETHLRSTSEVTYRITENKNLCSMIITAFVQAWGATRTFEKHLMALAEGLVGTGAQDSGYEAAKRRARNVTSGQAAQSADTSKSVFDVRSSKLPSMVCKRVPCQPCMLISAVRRLDLRTASH